MARSWVDLSPLRTRLAPCGKWRGLWIINETLLQKLHFLGISITPFQKCEEPDSNRRTPTGMDPKSIAFDLARRSSRLQSLLNGPNKEHIGPGGRKTDPGAALHLHPGHDTVDLVRGQLVELHDRRSKMLDGPEDLPDHVVGGNVLHSIEDGLLIDIGLF